MRDSSKFKSLLACWLDKSQARGEDFPELNAMLAAFGEYNWLAGARESYSWEELRLGAPFRRNYEKDRRAEAETSLLE